MGKLSCGCTPDESGYGWCGDCRRKLREKIWASMNDGEKKYDRCFSPQRSKDLDDAMDDYEHERGCSCHINPPCSYCVSRTDDED